MKLEKISVTGQKIVSMVLAFLMVLAMLPVQARAEGDTTITLTGEAYEGTYDSLEEAFGYMHNNPAAFTITLKGTDITLGEALEVPSDVILTLKSSDADSPVTIFSAEQRHFKVKGNLTLENIILDGKKAPGGVEVTNGTLTLNEGAIIQNCRSNANGVGVQVIDGTFTMSGGKIQYNEIKNPQSTSGGGLYLGSKDNTGAGYGSTGIMENGSIQYNTSLWGGGVEVSTSSTFTLKGGTIKNNVSVGEAEGGGGVHVYAKAQFIMEGGAVINNESACGGGGIYVGQGSHDSRDTTDPAIFIMENGEIKGNKAPVGAGVAFYRKAIGKINKGEITLNKASHIGGGIAIVNVRDIDVTITDGTISKNSASAGGGIAIEGTEMLNDSNQVNFSMTGGNITKNKANVHHEAITEKLGHGAAIFVRSNAKYRNQMKIEIGSAGDSFNLPVIQDNVAELQGGGIMLETADLKMYGGNITNNRAGTMGGGVCLDNSSTFSMENGNIAGNTANKTGGGVYLNKQSSFTMKNGNIKGNITQSFGGGIGLDNSSTFTMENGNIAGNTADNFGGGVYLNQSTLTMKDGNIEGNITKKSGGGVFLFDNSAFIMEDGNITGNAANGTGGGGGIRLRDNGTFTMESGKIEGNKTESSGGGIRIDGKGNVVTINAGTITGNNSYDSDGGGIYSRGNQNKITIKNAEISHNRSNNHGGGLYIASLSNLYITGGTRIINNTAASEGGGIYSGRTTTYHKTMVTKKDNPSTYDYRNIEIAQDTVFTGNTANGLYNPPSNASEFDNIGFKSNSENPRTNHPLNNYDINYAYRIKINYYPNVETLKDFKDTWNVMDGNYTVLSNADVNMIREGYSFEGWNTNPGGDGKHYKANTAYNITDDLNLYAQWKLKEIVPQDTAYSVTYDANGGSGSFIDSGWSYGETYTVNSVSKTGISYEGYIFTGWNTNPKGDGTAYAADQTFTIHGNVTLYAQWRVKLLNDEDHIKFLYGYPDGSVQAEGNITRAEASAIFYRLLKNKGITENSFFSDVSSNSWYSPDVNFLAKHGIISGYKDGTFRPDKYITRAEFATLAAHFDELSLSKTNVFSDVAKDHWAVGYINSAYVKGWVSGYPDGTFRPNENISRAEVVSVVNKMLKRAIGEESLAVVKNPYNDITLKHWAYADIMEATYEHEFDRLTDGTEKWKNWVLYP